MWQRWSKLLERLGRLRLGAPPDVDIRIGDPKALDAEGGGRWRRYAKAEALFDVWGPPPGSRWQPYHAVPLFAAIDRVPPERVGPTPSEPAGGEPILPHARPGAPRPPWVTPDTWTIVDLPGPWAVKVGAWLVTAAGCQPVCTFDNWPHQQGLVHPEHTLAELLRWACVVEDVRPAMTPAAPPVWICDSDRLGGRPGDPGDFDNRYYLDDSALPGPSVLKAAGIQRVVYVTLGAKEVPVLDLEAYFTELIREGLVVLHRDLAIPEGEPLRWMAPGTPRKPPREGFRRSAAGGFGTEVPEPSSGGGG